MLAQEAQQIFASDAIMSPGRARGRQLAGANPVRDCEVTHGTIAGDLASGEKSLLSLHVSPYTGVKDQIMLKTPKIINYH
jgi:hypothetical protein